MPVVKVVRMDRRNKESCYLSEYVRVIKSQHGEDGVIEKIFEIIGTKNKWCCEFGAWDGETYSNTYHLINNLGWTGVLIEGDSVKFAQLQKVHAHNRVHGVCEMVGFDVGKNTIDAYLASVRAPSDFDFISIDIDGSDWHIWDSIKEHRPRVVVIEFNQRVPNDVYFVQDRDLSINQGCSLQALVQLGKKKGYELVAVVNANAFFVVKEEFPKLGIADNSIDAMHLGSQTHIFFMFDGTLVNTLKAIALRQPDPDKRMIDPLHFQIYPPERRFFGDRVPPDSELGARFSPSASASPESAH